MLKMLDETKGNFVISSKTQQSGLINSQFLPRETTCLWRSVSKQTPMNDLTAILPSINPSSQGFHFLRSFLFFFLSRLFSHKNALKSLSDREWNASLSIAFTSPCVYRTCCAHTRYPVPYTIMYFFDYFWKSFSSRYTNYRFFPSRKIWGLELKSEQITLKVRTLNSKREALKYFSPFQVNEVALAWRYWQKKLPYLAYLFLMISSFVNWGKLIFKLLFLRLKLQAKVIKVGVLCKINN